MNISGTAQQCEAAYEAAGDTGSFTATLDPGPEMQLILPA